MYYWSKLAGGGGSLDLLGGWADNLFGNKPYVVQLEVFNGPMDLLLQIIQRRELDITVVSLAAVTDQYIQHIRTVDEPDPDQLADFLVIAAKLLAIKASVLLNRPQAECVEREDEGQDLVRALEEYRLFQSVAVHLRELETQGGGCFTRNVAVEPVANNTSLPEGLTLELLVTALRRRLEAIPPAAPATPAARSYTVRDKIVMLEAALETAELVLFDELLDHSCCRLEIIVTFLAVLELIKARRIAVSQSAIFDEIVISRAESNPAMRIGLEHEENLLVAV